MKSLLSAERRARAQSELLNLLSFNLDDGRIWLFGKRMLMLDAASFGALRDELITRLGLHGARSVLTRIGYTSGVSDANLVRARWPEDYTDYGSIGEYLHRLEGIAKIEPVRVNSQPERGHFDAEYLWHHAVEDDVHIVSQGLGTEPACWMETGYATGYVSRIFDRLILFREIECRSMGSPACRVICGPAEDWNDVDGDLEYLGLSESHRRSRRRAPRERESPEPAAARGMHDAPNGKQIVGASAALTAARILLERVAPTRATVLVTGETGVGKELFARALHALSPRNGGPFVAVNCAAIPDTLIESELFGVERGAFTGAHATRAGRFERAAGGTLFLDEVAALSPVAQAKLLRALQEGEVERVGGTRVLKSEARVVAATNVNLGDAVRDGRLREDLFFRLNVFPIELPPLRERRDDIPLLVEHFLEKYGRLHGRAVPRIAPRALQALLQYRFPGNIRELERIVERAVIMTDANASAIDLAQVQVPGERGADASLLFVGPDGALGRAQPAGVSAALATTMETFAQSLVEECAAGARPPIEDLGQELIRRIIDIAATRTGGNLAAAARLLGMKRHQLEYRLKRL